MNADRPVRVAIACQGGGAQTAFTAGALERLLEAEAAQQAGAGRRFEIVALSGTSGGALCAALAWCDLLLGRRSPGRLRRFWTAGYPDGIAAAPGAETWSNDLLAFLRKGEWPWLRTADRQRVRLGMLLLETDIPGRLFPFHLTAHARPYYFDKLFRLLDAMPPAMATRGVLENARTSLRSMDAVMRLPPPVRLWRDLLVDAISLNPLLPDSALRREFDVQETFRALLQRTFENDIAAIEQRLAAGGARHPELLIGAVDALNVRPYRDGVGDDLENLTNFKVFKGSADTHRLADVLLASAAIPDIMRAVKLDGTAYWDGLFSQNPPIMDLPDIHGPAADAAAHASTGNPEEIWMVLINPLRRRKAPEQVDEIADRRNELSGNISLSQELRAIRTMNGATVTRDREGGGTATRYYAPIEFPKPIQMSGALARRLKLPSKMNRKREDLQKLFEDGRLQAGAFLERWRKTHAQDHVAGERAAE